MPPITQLITGGQTGADQGALRAARAAKIPTGGYVPNGWLTEDGRAPWLADYGLEQLPTASYPARTRKNVAAAHATLILAEADDHNRLEGGTRLTFDIAYQQGKRGAGLYLADVRRPEMVADCVAWLRECMAQRPTLAGVPGFVLNVAGPRESKSPGIGAKVERFMAEVFRLLAIPAEAKG